MNPMLHAITTADVEAEFPVESGIEVPKVRRASGSIGKYPFASMGVGDSFMVKITGKEQLPPEKLRGHIASAAKTYAKLHEPGAAFISRKLDGGYRFWRIK